MPLPEERAGQARLRRWVVGRVIGVCGARGGVGTSVLAAGLARAGARRGPVALVDLDAGGGGLDVLLGVEDVPGPRWPDLRLARGIVPGAEVLELLPLWGQVRVLSADRRRPDPPSADVVCDVVTSLAEHADVVLDLARLHDATDLAARCDDVVLLVTGDVPAVAGASALLGRLEPGCVPRLVVRTGGALDAGTVGRALGLPVAHELRPDRTLPGAVTHGAGPCGRRLERAAKALGEQVRGGR